MIISKSNTLLNAAVALDVGDLTSGEIENVLDPNFSTLISSASETIEFTITTSAPVQYFALHGISLPIGSVVSVDGDDWREDLTLLKPTKNLVFHVEGEVTNSITVTVMGNGPKVISYIQAGLSTVIEWGTNSGQTLHYLGQTKKTRTTVNQRGVPTSRLTEETAPTLRLTIRNALKEWVRTDLQDVFDMYDQTGVLSLLDYEEEGRPDESYALFDLSAASPTTHAQTTKLMNLSLRFRAVA